jgi:hypothetical protein
MIPSLFSRQCQLSIPAQRVLKVGVFVAGLCSLLLGAGGCEKQNGGPIDLAGAPPFLRSATISPDSIPLTALTPVNGLYTLSVQVTAQVQEPAAPGSLGSVVAEALPPSGEDAIAVSSLHQVAIAGGVRSFGGQLQFTVSRSDVGSYRVRVSAMDQLGVEGNSVYRTLSITRINAPPTLSNLVAPDTVSLPQTGTVSIPMSVDVSDSNGLSDVREVFFRSLDSSNPTGKVFLFDDGAASHGDLAAGDGTYSVIIVLSSTNDRKTYRFAFQASDASGDTSATLLHRLTVK